MLTNRTFDYQLPSSWKKVAKMRKISSNLAHSRATDSQAGVLALSRRRSNTSTTQQSSRLKMMLMLQICLRYFHFGDFFLLFLSETIQSCIILASSYVASSIGRDILKSGALHDNSGHQLRRMGPCSHDLRRAAYNSMVQKASARHALAVGSCG